MKIPITFLGTGQAIPTAERNHTAVLIQYKDETILVDCGEGTQRQFRKAKINQCKLTRILITHWHGDHILGLPGLLQTLALNNYNKTLYVYGPRGTKKYFSLIYNMFVFVGKIKVQIEEVEEGNFLDLKDFYLEAMPMSHGAPCNAYSFVEKSKLRINKQKLKKLKLRGKIISEIVHGRDIGWQGKKIKSSQLTYLQEGKKITFIFDTSINENCYKIAKDSDLLISESTYLSSEKEFAEEYRHLTSEQAALIAKKAKVKKLIITHISQRYARQEEKFLKEAKKIFKNTQLAHDFLEVEV